MDLLSLQNLAPNSALHIEQAHMNNMPKEEQSAKKSPKLHTGKGVFSYAARKQKQLKYFQTVNHAKVIWDSKSKPKGIFGGHLNIRSVLSKREEVQHLLSESNLDFLALSETWLNTNIPTNMIDVPGYTCYRKDRLTGKGGGVLVYIKDIF